MTTFYVAFDEQDFPTHAFESLDNATVNNQSPERSVQQVEVENHTDQIELYYFDYDTTEQNEIVTIYRMCSNKEELIGVMESLGLMTNGNLELPDDVGLDALNPNNNINIASITDDYLRSGFYYRNGQRTNIIKLISIL